MARPAVVGVLIVSAVGALSGCGHSSAPSAAERSDVRAYVRIVERFRPRLTAAIARAAREQEIGFNRCPIAQESGATLPSELDQEPVWLGAELQAAAPVYAEMAGELSKLHSTQPLLRAATSRIRSNARILARFRHVNADPCRALTLWQRSRARRFDFAGAIGARTSDYPPSSHHGVGQPELKALIDEAGRLHELAPRAADRLRSALDITLWSPR